MNLNPRRLIVNLLYRLGDPGDIIIGENHPDPLFSIIDGFGMVQFHVLQVRN